LQFDDVYQKLRQARLLDEELIMEIEAYRYGLAYKETQIGYVKLRQRCNNVSELTGREITDGLYDRRLKKLSDPEIPVENKPFFKDKKNGKYNINFLFIEKNVEQRSKGLVRIVPPGISISEQVSRMVGKARSPPIETVLTSETLSFEVRDAKGNLKKRG
jgi:hypothetical protein